jgi:hypothetical protein
VGPVDDTATTPEGADDSGASPTGPDRSNGRSATAYNAKTLRNHPEFPQPFSKGSAATMHFNRFGLAFDYPDNWSIDTDDAQDRYAVVTVYSPEGGFWSVSGHAAGGDPAELAGAVLAQMRQEYQDLDNEPAGDEVAGHALTGLDINFYCLDLTNTAQVRTLETVDAIYLVICQAEDREWERVSPVFAAITTSFVTALPEPLPDDE